MPLKRMLTHWSQTSRGRIMAGVAANLTGKFWVIAVQLCSVPILSRYWGATGYGAWLMLSTVPSYIALSSFGFGTAAAVDMTKRYAREDRVGAVRTFQSIWLLISLITGAILLVTLAASALQLHFSWFDTHLAGQDILLPVLLLVIYTIVAMQMTIINLGFQSVRRYAQGTFIQDLLIPLEAIGALVATVVGHTYAAAALSMLIIRLVGCVVYYRILQVHEPWLKLGFRDASWPVVRQLTGPAFATTSLTLSAVLNLQGIILTMGIFVSPAAVAVFATARMLTRAPLQFVGLVGRATLPELISAHASHDKARSMRYVIISLLFTLAIAVPATVFMIAMGPQLLDMLSHHHLSATRPLFVWLALAALFQAIWTSIGQFLLAINRQKRFAYRYLWMSLGLMGAPFFFQSQNVMPACGLIWALVEGVTMVLVYRIWSDEEGIGVRDVYYGILAIVRPSGLPRPGHVSTDREA